MNDFDSAKKKLSIENSDLLRQLEEAESQVSQLSKIKISLTTQLEDTKRLADEEGRVSLPVCDTCRCVLDAVLCEKCRQLEKYLSDKTLTPRDRLAENFETTGDTSRSDGNRNLCVKCRGINATNSEEVSKKVGVVAEKGSQDKYPVMAEFPILKEDTEKSSDQGRKKEYYSVLPGLSFK